MRILGIDPGLTRCGVGVVELGAGRRVRFIHAGVIRTPAGDPLETRLLAVSRGISALIAEFTPGAVAVERVFAQHNLRTVMGTAQASGIALAVAAEHGLPVGLHTPSEVKAAITGYGSAAKAQVGNMVMRILALDEVPKPADAADALALAICHGWRGMPGVGLDTRPSAATRPPKEGLTAAQVAWREAEKSAGKRRVAS
ncbi:MAG: crossover junction endodeoxyribonuclease RuvC [Pseudolysinimonas sp.]|uniref:crossover junction endodeoxyribonuclease RuvC n=1 Tax=Pseudolysinimonas sp. TaxID=2680009 RepID=UPI003C707B7E